MTMAEPVFVCERDASLRGVTIGRWGGPAYNAPSAKLECAVFVKDSEWREFVATVLKANASRPERIRAEV